MSEKIKNVIEKIRSLSSKEIKLNIPRKDKKRLLVLAGVLLAVTLLTILQYRIFCILRGDLPSIILNISFYILIAGVGIAGMMLSGMDIKSKLLTKGAIQVVFGVVSGLILLFLIAVVPSFFGVSIIGWHTEYTVETYIYEFLFYFIFVGPVEEMIFRVFVQDTLTEILPKAKWIGVISASLLFGLWHIISGTWEKVLITSCIGLYWGFCRYFFKSSTFISTSISHALYDFGLLLAVHFIVK